ncbi:hypothetical protein ABKS89_25085 [Pseudomonas sp. LABIM340]|uniref:hypothetical protein n=1 Tax=Pseudomonas sp. LABIM340 TaxID=3156585 RepID=UPI0032AFFD86
MPFDLTRLQKCLMSLSALKRFLEDALRPAKSIPRQDLRESLASYLLICVHSFDQEWKRLSGMGKDDAEIRRTLELASPLVKRIRRWKGLAKLRSRVLAHEPYDKDSMELVDLREYFGEGKAPTEFWEAVLLAECAVWAIAIAITRHEAEQEAAKRIIYADGPHRIPPCGVSSEEDLQAEMDAFKRDLLSDSPDLAVMFPAS